MGNISLERKIYITRIGNSLKLSFKYDENIVKRVKELPFSRFDPDERSWYVEITSDSLSKLNSWFENEGLTDIYPQELINENEKIIDTPEAILRKGSKKRPFLIFVGKKSDNLFNRLKSIPGAQWEMKIQAMSYPPLAHMAIIELIERNIVIDPEQIMRSSELTLTYDGRDGHFKVIGDPRAQTAFDEVFPKNDIVTKWREKGFECKFSDEFSEEIYYGELRRGCDDEIVKLKEELFKYQREAVNIAVKRSGFAIFDAPGVGKTPQAIAWGKYLLDKNEAERCVIVTPGAIKTQFAREIMRFTGDNDIVIIEGDKKKRAEKYLASKNARWVILNYDLLNIDIKEITPLVTNQLLVADEVHKIKSRQSKRGQAMRLLSQKAHKRLALSGTPVENDPGEWYSIMSGFVVPGIFGSVYDYFNRYAYPGRFGGYEGARNLKELRERSKMHYIRRNKKEVATHLPPLIVKNLVLDAEEKLQIALKRVHKDAQDEIRRAKKEKKNLPELFEEEEGSTAMTAVGMLRLICSSPRLIYMSESESAKALCEAGLIPEIDGPKLDELRSTAIEMQANNERLVVFTSFRKMAKLIAERFDEDGIRYVLFTGETNSKERDIAVKKFTEIYENENEGPTVFLATDAASEGLNLGKMCSTLINFDLAFKPSTMIQRANRIHRVDGNVLVRYEVINYTIAKTIEEGIIAMVGQKADLSDAILGESGSRHQTTGRNGRNVFENAIENWGSNE